MCITTRSTKAHDFPKSDTLFCFSAFDLRYTAHSPESRSIWIEIRRRRRRGCGCVLLLLWSKFFEYSRGESPIYVFQSVPGFVRLSFDAHALAYGSQSYVDDHVIFFFQGLLLLVWSGKCW